MGRLHLRVRFLTQPGDGGENSQLFTGSNRLRIAIHRAPDGMLCVRPAGVLNEDVNFSEILRSLLATGAPRSLEFDLIDVSRINSSGVRQWLLLMEQIPASIPVTFVQVPELMVDQANMIHGMFMRRGARLISFQAPYACDGCGFTLPQLLRAADVVDLRQPGKVPTPPVMKCPKCDEARYRFDGIPQEYFQFLRAPVPSSGPAAK